MTFLQLVNETLRRLRENEVTTVTQNAYSKMIGDFVNDAKRQCEDAWNWDALSVTIPVITDGINSNYVVTGSGFRQKAITVNDTTNRAPIRNVPIQWILDQQQLSQVGSGAPCYYAWNGYNGTDSKVEFWPTPNGAYTIEFNMVVPQVKLTADSDVLTAPIDDAVVAGAYARALAERGEDGALQSSEAYGLFKGILADLIALEANRFVENDCWEAC